MSRTLPIILTLAALSTSALAQAPIERAYPHEARRYHRAPKAIDPVPGVRVITAASLDTVAADPDHSEFRLDHGRATVSIDHPADGALILFDLPNGQADLLKDGVYALNANTNTLTVLRGEADVFPPNAPSNAKGTTVREGQTITLGPNARPHDASRAELAASYLPGVAAPRPYYGGDYVTEPAFAPYPYDDGFYGYGWDYPYYGFGWGYPDIGFGWGGGFYRGYGRGFGGHFRR